MLALWESKVTPDSWVDMVRPGAEIATLVDFHIARGQINQPVWITPRG